MKPRETLSPLEARRIALAAQGFAARKPAQVGRKHLTGLVGRLGVIQIDSVNVVSRTHYLPFFSRLGAYPRALLEDVAWGRRSPLIEYWAHEASLLPLAAQPLFRWRMEDALAGVGVWKGVARTLREHKPFVDKVLAEIGRRGPLTASELGHGAPGQKGWWGWSEGKRALECLFWTGQVTARTRRNNFERIYDLTERALPAGVMNAPTPDRGEAQRALILAAARAQGVATERDLRDYFRMGPAESRVRIAELVEAGELSPVKVKGWREPAYLDPRAVLPRRVTTDALLSPFDNLIWFRERAERMFGVKVRLEIYTPEAKRTHGYYVLPFLQGEAITARVDLKADRKAGMLLVQASHAEPWADAETPARLAAQLSAMAGWLGLDRVQVKPKGDLAKALADAT